MNFLRKRRKSENFENIIGKFGNYLLDVLENVQEKSKKKILTIF